MKTSTHLFELIHSLKKGEKRYFKIVTSVHTKGEEKNCIRLFDAIDKQKVCNEMELLKKYKDEPFSHNFRFAKHYLYRLILKSMRTYYSSTNLEPEIQNTIQDINYLYSKGLYSHCHQLLGKVKKTAANNEKHFLMLDLLRLEHKIMPKWMRPAQTYNLLDDVCHRQLQLIDNLSNIIRYQWLSDKLFALSKYAGHSVTKKNQLKYKQIREHPLLQNEKQATTNISKILFHQILAAYYFIIKEYRQSNKYSLRTIELIENKGIEILNNPVDYLVFLSNLISSHQVIGNQSIVRDLIQKSRSILKNAKTDVPPSIPVFIYGQELSFYFHSAQFQMAADMIPQFSVFLTKNQKDISSDIHEILNYNFAYIHFILGKYKDALAGINQIINKKQSLLRQDIRIQTNMLNLLVQFELGNIDYVDKLSISLNRLLVKEKAIGTLEKILLELIFKLLSLPDQQREMTSFFQTSYMEVKAVLKVPSEFKKLEQFDYFSWLESKIQKRSFAEVLKEKAKTKVLI